MSTPIERLATARELADQGRYDAALQALAWFHEHALEHDPSLQGVRRSYALADWAMLAEAHPPAAVALEAVRERNTALLLAGQGNRDHLLDVVSIDHACDQPVRTRDLFVKLEALAPALAASCIRVVLPQVIAAGDAALAERLMPNPEENIRQHADYLMDAFRARRQRFTGAPSIPAEIHNYVQDVNAILDVLAARGRHADVRRLRRLAADAIPATTLRREVRAALVPGAPAWYERGVPRRRNERVS
ncbi:hypothetical protein [Massilia sp. UYP11]|uniref:hypothetical protein n=1 Tax=Massilia sp. UYP11 TaxID=1756385 RepID=UPI003D196D7A